MTSTSRTLKIDKWLKDFEADCYKYYGTKGIRVKHLIFKLK